MARHRRQSKRRTYNKNRRSSRKMRGGVAETDRQALTNLGFTEQNINYLIANNPNMLLEFVQNSINPPPNNPFFTESQTPAQFMTDIMANNETINESEAFETPPKPSKRARLEENSNVSDYYEPDYYEPDISATPTNLNNFLGGKRKSKRRTSIKKRKTRKVRRNRRQQGGRGFTTEEEINPLAYIDRREISEANMPRP